MRGTALTQSNADDPLRQSLAAALRESKEASEAAERQRRAIRELDNQVRDELQRAVMVGEKGVDQAQHAYAGAVAKAAVDGKKPPASGVKAARQALLDAQDELDAQKAALKQLEADLPTWEHEARERTIAVESAISAILASELQVITKRAEAILTKFWPLRAALQNALQASSSEHRSGVEDSLAFQRGRQQFRQAALTAHNAILKPLTARNAEASPESWGVLRELLRRSPYAELPDAAGGVNTGTDAVDAA